jgi:Kdo2-lipid IVA lauroyltransferase/acyltransferase
MKLRHQLEYAPVWLLVHGIGVLPRPLARMVGILLGYKMYFLLPRLRRVGMRNLEIAFPGRSKRERKKILRGVYRSLGRQLAEFCLFPRYTRENTKNLFSYDGFENYEAAHASGKGIFYLTAHLGAWEVSSFVHSLYGHPMHIIVRALDNPYVQRLVERYRSLHGNRTHDKDDFARGLIEAMRKGEGVGVLMDTNMTPPQGLFVDFFGTPACTASGVARVALRTGAAVVPAFMIWDSVLSRYRLHFEPALELVRTGDDEADAIANTARFTKAIEDIVRRFPDQWLWVHRRWKTRPEGAPPIY